MKTHQRRTDAHFESTARSRLTPERRESQALGLLAGLLTCGGYAWPEAADAICALCGQRLDAHAWWAS